MSDIFTSYSLLQAQVEALKKECQDRKDIEDSLIKEVHRRDREVKELESQLEEAKDEIFAANKLLRDVIYSAPLWERYQEYLTKFHISSDSKPEPPESEIE